MARAITCLSLLVFVVANILLLPVTVVHGFARGAPATACENLVPGHKVPAQTAESPYVIRLDTTELRKLGENVTITIESKDPTSPVPFKGFLVMGQHDDEDDHAAGDIYEAPEQLPKGVAKHLDCGGDSGANSAMTHSSKVDKTKVVLQWVPPDDHDNEKDDNYVIYATIVKDYSTFWVKQQSVPINVQVNNPNRKPGGHSHGNGGHTHRRKSSGCSTLGLSWVAGISLLVVVKLSNNL